MHIACARLPITQVEDATSPIEAEACAPSEPTIAASIYCIRIEEICERIPGMLSFLTKFICCLNESVEEFFNS